MVLTTEWLVDHSSVICVVDVAGNEVESKPNILSTLKGNAAKLDWPLKKAELEGYFYFGPPASGTVRLLFINENGELWQAVQLGRKHSDSPTLFEAFYGVDQYGKIHLSESSLFRAIRTHIAVQPSKSIARLSTSNHFARSGIEAPSDFPFESAEETFVLVVDFNTRRRDFYLRQLSEGDCAERLHAIRELSQLVDTAAVAGIEAATRVTGVNPSYTGRWAELRVDRLSDESVRLAARKALKEIEKSRQLR
ncbi:MAG: hypothetical protein AAF483_21570 [Planctomycetota bacterium]